MDYDGSDLFVHFDELTKANITKEMLKDAKTGNITFSFLVMEYAGKRGHARKAVNVRIMSYGDRTPGSASTTPPMPSRPPPTMMMGPLVPGQTVMHSSGQNLTAAAGTQSLAPRNAAELAMALANTLADKKDLI